MIFRKYHHSEDDVRRDFECQTFSVPFRCTLCNLMQPNKSTVVWVSDSAFYFKGEETYQSLVNGGKTDRRSGACIDCVRRYK